MKHIVRMVVMAVAFASLLSASPLFAQRVKEPDEKPAPSEQSLWCTFACFLGGEVGGFAGCDCSNPWGWVSSLACDVQTQDASKDKGWTRPQKYQICNTCCEFHYDGVFDADYKACSALCIESFS